jgi:hypothetical protein
MREETHGEPEQEKRSFRDFAKGLCMRGRTWPQIRAVARATMWSGHIPDIASIVEKRGDVWREAGAVAEIERERRERKEKRIAKIPANKPQLRITVPAIEKAKEPVKKKVILKFAKKMTKS